MSTTLITDTPDETTVRRDEHGWYAIRSALLLNVSGGASAIVYNAIQDALLTANNYNISQAHPTMTALYCSLVEGKAVDVDKVAIRAEYRPYQQIWYPSKTQVALMSIGATVQSGQQNVDINGNQMNVPDPTSTTALEQVLTAAVDAAQFVITFKRREPAYPFAAFAYINSTNLYACNIHGQGFAIGTLKLDRVNAEPVDNASASPDYNVTYEMVYNPNGWQVTGAYVDPTSGQVLNSAPTPYPTFTVYGANDFNGMDLW